MKEFIFIFFVFALGGWIIEFAFRSTYERRLVNPGFNKGPWLPVYGFTGLVIFVVYSDLSGAPLLVRMVFYYILCSAFEFLAGVFLEKAFHRRYWDYSENKFNLKGYICPLYSSAWVVISVFVEFFILPVLLRLISSMPRLLLAGADAVLLAVFVTDFLFSSGIMHEFRSGNLRDRFSR